MNIAIDLRPLLTPYRTGVGEYTFELLNTLFTQDKTNEYFLFYNSAKDVSELIPHWSQPNIQFVATHYPNKLLNASIALTHYPHTDAIANLKSKILNLKFDYFFSPNLNFTCLSPGTRHILTIHDISYFLFPYFYSPKQRLWHRALNPLKQIESAHRILTPSENTKQDIVRYFKISPDKISIIYPGLSSTFTHFQNLDDQIRSVALQSVKQKYRLPDNFILYLGTIEPRKNVTSIIQAFEQSQSKIENQKSKIHLVLAGSPGWHSREVFQAIQNSPYRDRIKFIGYVDAEDKPALYSLAKLFVYPSFYEGFGFPVLEAMSMGTPVITSNRSSLPEVTGDAAYLAHPHRVEEIADGMKVLTTNETLRQAQIKKALEVSTRFTWQDATNSLLSLLTHS